MAGLGRRYRRGKGMGGGKSSRIKQKEIDEAMNRIGQELAQKHRQHQKNKCGQCNK